MTGRGSETAYVALGANLGDPVRQVEKGIEALAGLPRTRLTGRSSLYRTAPVGVRGQPEFINAVVRLATGLDPVALLAALFDVEAAFGRIRGDGIDPRTLDLDLVLFGALAGEFAGPPQLRLPHPRLHLRAFVLAPLLEIDPAAGIPGRGTAAAWMPAVRHQPIAVLR